MYRNTVKIDGMACGMCEAHTYLRRDPESVSGREEGERFPQKEGGVVSDGPAGG